MDNPITSLLRCVTLNRVSVSTLACENILFSSLFAAGDVSTQSSYFNFSGSMSTPTHEPFANSVKRSKRIIQHMTYSVAGRKISLELAKFERKTITRQEETDMAGELILCVFYTLLAILITSVNVLIIVIFFREKLRRKRSNYLLISLAVADLLVGVLVLPLFITVTLTRPSPQVASLSYLLDIITGLASIFTLGVISLERMYAVCWPFLHQKLSQCSYVFASCMPWALVVSGPVIGRLIADHYLSDVLIITSLLLPLTIICSSYVAIWRKLGNSVQRNHRPALQLAQEKKLAKTLLMIIGVFVVTWLPFEVINIYIIACRRTSCNQPHVNPVIIPILYVTVFLRISNSFMNFIVYSLRMPDFKQQLCKTLQPCSNFCISRQDTSPEE